MKSQFVLIEFLIFFTFAGKINGRRAGDIGNLQTAQNLNGIRLELVKQLQVCDVDRFASEVYQFSGYIFAQCYRGESVVHVYDAKTYQHLEDTRWDVPGNSIIDSLYANPESKSLYVRVELISGSGDTTWKITVNNRSTTLYNTVYYRNAMHSVSAKDHALIVHYPRENPSDNTMYLYGADGQELERFRLPKGLIDTLVEETESGTFLFYREYREDDPFTIKEMNKQGEIIQSYYPRGNNLNDQLTHPFRKVTDKYGHHFVTDVDSPSLFVVDRNLTMSRAILTVDVNYRAFYTIAYDESEDNLLVVPWTSSPYNVVNIYKIHYAQ